MNMGARKRRSETGDESHLDEPPPDAGVGEPRRPRPAAPGGAALLELPPTDLGWNP
jgi:hypothetical protein